MVATAAVVSAALLVVPSAGGAGAGHHVAGAHRRHVHAVRAPQRNGDPAYGFAPTSISTGNSNWFTSAPRCVNVSATDNVGVDQAAVLDRQRCQLGRPAGHAAASVAAARSPTKATTPCACARSTPRATCRPASAAATTLNQAAGRGATAVRLAARTAASSVTSSSRHGRQRARRSRSRRSRRRPPASPAPNVTLTAPLTKCATRPPRSCSRSRSSATSRSRSTRRPRRPTWPTGVGVNNRIGHGVAQHHADPHRSGARLGQPRRARGLARRHVGLPAAARPVQALARQAHLGAEHHRRAGNGNKVKFTFLVTTSLADLDALLAKCGTAGTIPAATVTTLRARSPARQDRRRRGRQRRRDQRARRVRLAGARGHQRRRPQPLITDTNDVVRQLRGIPDAAGPGRPRHHPQRRPGAAAPPVRAAVGAGAQRQPGVQGPRLLQPPGRRLVPSPGDRGRRGRRSRNSAASTTSTSTSGTRSTRRRSLSDTPFTSAANLAQYEVIIGDSSVGNNVLNTAYRMKDGTVVNEQAAFQELHPAGGGYVALHARQRLAAQLGLVQGLPRRPVRVAPGQPERLRADCGSCYWAEVNQRGSARTRRWRPPACRRRSRSRTSCTTSTASRAAFIHVLQTLNEDTYAGAMGVGANAANLESGDHPIVWCSNYDGGREWSQVLGHNWELYRTAVVPREHLPGHPDRGGHEARQLRHAHRGQDAAGLARRPPAGSPPAAVTAGTASVERRSTKYMTLDKSGYSSSLSDIDALRALAQNPASGDAASRAKLLAKAQELKNWMGVLLGSTSTGGTAAARSRPRWRCRWARPPRSARSPRASPRRTRPAPPRPSSPPPVTRR